MLRRVIRMAKAERKQARRRGQPYTGPVAWCDDPQQVLRPAYYAVSSGGPEGRILADTPLVCVDDAPWDENDGSHHFEYAGPNDYPQRRADGTKVEKGQIVQMEAERIVGKAGLA